MKGKYITLEKLEGINNLEFPIGNTLIRGILKENIEIRKPILLYLYVQEVEILVAWTSEVVEYSQEDSIIKTQNSTYKIHIDD